jgi:hypothetical protein
MQTSFGGFEKRRSYQVVMVHGIGVLACNILA